MNFRIEPNSMSEDLPQEEVEALLRGVPLDEWPDEYKPMNSVRQDLHKALLLPEARRRAFWRGFWRVFRNPITCYFFGVAAGFVIAGVYWRWQ